MINLNRVRLVPQPFFPNGSMTDPNSTIVGKWEVHYDGRLMFTAYLYHNSSMQVWAPNMERIFPSRRDAGKVASINLYPHETLTHAIVWVKKHWEQEAEEQEVGFVDDPAEPTSAYVNQD